MKFLLKHLRLSAFALTLSLGLPASAADFTALGEQAIFQVTLTSLSGDLKIGDFEEFEIAIVDSSGAPVAGATVVFSGGMPGHGHGFPTAPTVSEIGGGLYKLEGVKFSMGGAWEINLTISADSKTDTASVQIEM
ncbi:FixH family protein [Gemmobacter fulvus]|uniref:FixH family protein n=1 Tax=Gemmobacter fulvus TaxID=2840474 RepID=UPI0027964514|nr:FixH family protein [Gemmobacter fulvus]MDQ1850749.1 FixH family protein [Gemmobacter fulvus]